MTIAIDAIEGLKHPAETTDFYGNEAAEYALYQALQSSRMHHAWIFNGPKGVGKATLAYRFARRYLGAAPSDESPLASKKDDPIVSKIANHSLGDIRVATRYCPEAAAVKRDVSVAAIRELTNMFSLKSSNQFGRRVAIVDSVDDLREAGANALLKTLEEPPKGAVLILIANSLGSILPTIRSRCRLLTLNPLSDDELKTYLPRASFAQMALANGCYGRALALEKYDIDTLYGLIASHLNSFPKCPMDRAFALADMARDSEVFDLIFELLSDWLYRATNAGLGLYAKEIEAGESAILAKLTSGIEKQKLFDSWQNIQKLRNAVANNLDRGVAILEVLKIIRKTLENK